MKRAKNILMAVALLLAAMPCCRAFLHLHEAGGVELSAHNECACHACDRSECSILKNGPQATSATGVAIEPPAFVAFLAADAFAVRTVPPKPPTAAAILAALGTVQLLI